LRLSPRESRTCLKFHSKVYVNKPWFRSTAMRAVGQRSRRIIFLLRHEVTSRLQSSHTSPALVGENMRHWSNYDGHAGLCSYMKHVAVIRPVRVVPHIFATAAVCMQASACNRNGVELLALDRSHRATGLQTNAVDSVSSCATFRCQP
jgi:hypothetical protein